MALNKLVKSKPAQLRVIPGPKCYPVIGNRQKFHYQNYHHYLKKLYRSYGPIVKVKYFDQEIIHLFSPDYTQLLFQNQDKLAFIKPLMETTQMYRKLRDMSPGLGNMNGDDWYNLRTAINPILMRPDQITNALLPEVNQSANKFIDFVSQSDTFSQTGTAVLPDIQYVLSCWQLSSCLNAMFNNDYGFLSDGGESKLQVRKLIKANLEIFQLTAQLRFANPLFKSLPFGPWRELVRQEDMFFGWAQTVFNENMHLFSANVAAGTLGNKMKFLQYLMTKQSLSQKEVSIIVMSIIADGLSTTTPTLVYLLFSLATNPDSQQRLRKELQEVLSDDVDDITEDQLKKLSYTKACIKETTRLYTISTEISRVLKKPLKIGSFTLDTGTAVEANTQILCNTDEFFPMAADFFPERWIRGEKLHEITAERVHPFLLMPFGHGTRMCAGRRFAELEMIVLIAKIFRRFNVKMTAPNPRMETKYATLIHPTFPHSVEFSVYAK